MNEKTSASSLLATLVAMMIVLPVAGYIWSLPLSNFMITTSLALGLVCLILLVLVFYFWNASAREMARLAEELKGKSAQVLELVEAEREDDRIIESLTERINQLKANLLLVQSKHIAGQSGVSFPETAVAAASQGKIVLDSAPVPEHPQVFTPHEFRLLAAQFSRVASRYERQFTIVRIRMNIDDRIKKVGHEKAHAEYEAAVQAIIRTLRVSDFATPEGSDSIVIGYPETSPVHVDAILSRMRSVLKSSDASELEIVLDQTNASSDAEQ